MWIGESVSDAGIEKTHEPSPHAERQAQSEGGPLHAACPIRVSREKGDYIACDPVVPWPQACDPCADVKSDAKFLRWLSPLVRWGTSGDTAPAS